MKNIISSLIIFIGLIQIVNAQEVKATSLGVSDTRNENQPPNSYHKQQGIRAEFKFRNIIGVPGIGNYSGTLTFAPWNDVSGNKIHQMNFNDGGIFYRNGSQSETQWGKWRELLVANENGNVGIGTGSPLSKLHVSGGLRITGTSPNYAGPTLIFGESGNPNAEYGNYNIEYIPKSGLNFSIPWPNSGYGNFDLFLSVTRKVGMGTNNFSCSDCSEYRLFVKNGIKTEKIKVEIASENQWADYVFNADYELRDLNEVENFIKQNGHLPEVPSAKEAVENGIELKEMNVLLLKKIEELTLYSIEQNLALQKQSEKIENLEHRLNIYLNIAE